MKTHRVLAATSLVAMIACSSVFAQSAANPDAPERGPDGRVAPTIKADNETYSYTSVDERLEKLNKANKERNKWLSDHPLPLAVAVRVPDGSIKIDGKLDEAVWKQAPVITGFKDVKKEGGVAEEQTKIRMLWDSKYLYIGAQCDDSDMVATAKEHDGDVWADDALEIFINPTGDEMSYLQLAINPLGTWYDAAIADYRPESDFKPAALDMEKAKAAFNTKDSKWAVTVDGTVGAGSDAGSDAGTTQPAAAQPAKASKGWTAEIAIAWTDIARGANVLHQVPQDGDVLRMNFGRDNINSSGDTTTYSTSAWSPTPAWFHNPCLFGRVVLINGDGSDQSQAKPSADAPTPRAGQ